jgi:hypothetical protein
MLTGYKLLAAALVLSLTKESLSFSMTGQVVHSRSEIFSKLKYFNRASEFGSDIRSFSLRDQRSFRGQLCMSQSSDANNVASFMLQAVQGCCEHSGISN